MPTPWRTGGVAENRPLEGRLQKPQLEGMFGKSVYSVKDTIMIHIASHRFFEPIQKQIFLQKESDFHTVDGHNTGILSWGYFLKSHLTLQDNDFDSLLFQVNTLPETNVAPEKKIFVEDGRLLAFFSIPSFQVLH